MMRTAAVAAVAGTILTGISPAARGVSAPNVHVLRDLINEERAEQGRPPVTISHRLSLIANRHSRKMGEEQQLFHNPRLTSDLQRITWQRAGENVGVGTDIREVHAAFMASAPHRHNTLRAGFDRLGVGLSWSADHMWVTLVYVG